MGNIEDYVKWRGDLTFKQDPFNEVDNLVLAQLSYVDLKDIVPSPENGDKITLRQAVTDFFELNDEQELKLVQSFIWEAPFFMREIASHPRYANLLLSNYVDCVDAKEEMQFAAFHIGLGDQTTYIAFKGTDDTIIGWKEDFNMSFMTPVPSQTAAAEYVNRTVRAGTGKLRLGGHSKGGNLAIYAAVKCSPRIRRRILEVYNNDGPGFDKEMIMDAIYQQMLPRVKTIVPQHSVVGMLLEHEERYMVVKSSQNGVMQHDAMSWQVMGNRFETVKSVSPASAVFNEAISRWINSLSKKQRSEFVDTLFSIIMASGAKTLSDINADRFNTAGAAFKMYTSLDRNTKSMMRKMLRSLNSEFDRARKKSREVKKTQASHKALQDRR